MELAREGNFDPIILDLMMPKIMVPGPYAHPGVLQTSLSSCSPPRGRTRTRSWPSGADDYTTKPQHPGAEGAVLRSRRPRGGAAPGGCKSPLPRAKHPSGPMSVPPGRMGSQNFTAKEFDLMELFRATPPGTAGRTCSMWCGGEYIGDYRTVDAQCPPPVKAGAGPRQLPNTSALSGGGLLPQQPPCLRRSIQMTSLPEREVLEHREGTTEDPVFRPPPGHHAKELSGPPGPGAGKPALPAFGRPGPVILQEGLCAARRP